MVGEVVGAEGGGVGDSDGEVGEDGQEAIGERGFEGEVVGDFVDGEEEVLVCCGAYYVGGEEKGPGEEGGVAEGVGAGDLQGDDGEDEGDGEGFGAAEFEDLSQGMLVNERRG